MKLKNISFAVAAALTLFQYAGAHAATATTTSINAGVATDTSSTGGAGPAGASNAGSFTINRYSGSDVLVGASFSAGSGSFNVNFTRGSGTNNPDGTATVTAAFAVGGETATATATANASAVGGSGQSVATSYSSPTTTVSNANLANFYGAGTLTGSVTESAVVSKTDSGSRSISADPAAHTATVTYNYSTLGHADGSFDAGASNSLSLDFGTLAYNTGASQGFGIFNGSGLFSLDIMSITCISGSCGAFNLANTFLNIAGGSSQAGTVDFLAQTPLISTNYAATFALVVGDSTNSFGLGKNGNIETLTLNLAASVNPLAAPVPEPETYSMVLAGLALMGCIGRRRRTS